SPGFPRWCFPRVQKWRCGESSRKRSWRTPFLKKKGRLRSSARRCQEQLDLSHLSQLPDGRSIARLFGISSRFGKKGGGWRVEGGGWRLMVNKSNRASSITRHPPPVTLHPY